MDNKLKEILATQHPTNEQISWLSRAQISWLSSEQISWLSRAQISGLSRAQISGLSSEQISWLSRAQISGLSRAQISWLSRAQISWLSRAQISWLSLENVPFVEKLYTKILATVEKEKENGGMLDQSDFGQSNQGLNVCGTPMCIGGTTVWLAGEAGYKLADEFGYATAAALIHRKSRPDTPTPRYDNYPNSWALAFIQARAKEEQEAK
jgi:hypothetical protein